MADGYVVERVLPDGRTSKSFQVYQCDEDALIDFAHSFRAAKPGVTMSLKRDGGKVMTTLTVPPDPAASTVRDSIAVILDRSVSWRSVSSGELNPLDVFTKLAGKEPTQEALSIGLYKHVGSRMIKGELLDYSKGYELDTAVDGFYLVVRAEERNRRLGYVIHPDLDQWLYVERQHENAINGKWLEHHDMPEGSKSRAVYKAMVEALRFVGESCGYEMRETPKPATPVKQSAAPKP